MTKDINIEKLKNKLLKLWDNIELENKPNHQDALALLEAAVLDLSTPPTTKQLTFLSHAFDLINQTDITKLELNNLKQEFIDNHFATFGFLD